MWVLITLFAIALVTIVSIFISTYLRRGRSPEITGNNPTWLELKPDVLKSELREQSRVYMHRLVLLLLKIWIRIAYFIRKQEQTMRVRITRYLHANAQKMNDRKPPVSKFLKHISDHKQQAKTEEDQLMN